jgi:hypothetical protein
MRLREIRRSPAQHLDFLLGGLDPAHRGSQLSRVGRRGPDPLPSSMSAFFNHEYNVVKWIPKSFAIFVAGEQCPNRRRGSARVEAMDLRSLIARGSVRSFGPEPVPRQVVQFLVDQARWTGSARNGQPWRFVAVYDQCVRAELARCGAYAGHLENAPVALVLLSPATHRYDTEFDLGRVAQSITLAAAEQSLPRRQRAHRSENRVSGTRMDRSTRDGARLGRREPNPRSIRDPSRPAGHHRDTPMDLNRQPSSPTDQLSCDLARFTPEFSLDRLATSRY